MSENREIVFGTIPLEDGSDYDDSRKEPSLEGLIALIRRQRWDRVVVVAVGKLGSPGRKVSRIAVNTNIESIINASVSGAIAGGASYHERVGRMLNAKGFLFKHVSAFIVSPR